MSEKMVKIFMLIMTGKLYNETLDRHLINGSIPDHVMLKKTNQNMNEKEIV